jgi:hypothetical protein
MTTGIHTLKLEFYMPNDGGMEKWFSLNNAQLEALRIWSREYKSPNAWQIDGKSESRPGPKQVERWLNDHGIFPDRSDGPAIILKTCDGTLTESWLKAGKPCRADGGPTEVETYMDKIGVENTLTEKWQDENARLHRENGPAKVLTFNGGVALLTWYDHGREGKSRETGPVHGMREPQPYWGRAAMAIKP